MNINRHNYEEFFLLFADNELSAADRKAVEIFVAENPDLKKELQLLLQTVSSIDDVVFENKEQLLKPAVTALQEKLLLHIDDELPAAEKQQLLQLINSDAAAAKELALLQQIKLQPDTAIVFANKKELYRKEEGRVVRIAWWRAAAAAVLLGFGTWGTLTLIKPAQQQDGVTTAGNKIHPVIENNIGNNNTSSNKKNEEQLNTNTATAKSNTAVKTNDATQKNNLPVNNNAVKQQDKPAVNNNNNNVVKNNKKETNNLPEPVYNNFNNSNRNETIAANVTPTEDPIKKANSGAAALIESSSKLNTTAVNGYAITAAYNADEAEEPNNNKVLYMNEENVKRSKLGGFIRKVKRVVERTANVKTGNSIKVAGFDIALNK